MPDLELDDLVLHYCRQIILKEMVPVPGAMRDGTRLLLKCALLDPQIQKSQNLTESNQIYLNSTL